MFANVLNEVTSRLDSRFILTLFFPSLLFWGGLGVVYATDQGLALALNRWRAQDVGVQVGQIVLALAWVTFFAYLLSNQLIWLTKQFEGYWTWLPFLGRHLFVRRQAHYRKLLNHLDQTDHYEAIYYGFPFPNEPEELLPTRLGNILKNAERYPLQRYDIAAVLFWPRLYGVLPDSFAKTLESARASLDFMLVVSALSALFAFVTGAYLLITQGLWWLFLFCFLGGFVVAYLAYLSALEAAVTYGQLIKGTFDLYKDELREKLGYKRPKSLEKEREFWSRLYELVYKGETGDPQALVYPSETNSADGESETTPAESL